MTGLVLFSVLLLAWSSASSPGQPDRLNHHNDDSDVFCYNPCCLVVGHQRVVQGLETAIDFSFHAFGRTFDINLFPEKDVFSSTPTVHYSHDNVHNVDISHLYQGTVRGVPGSSVYLYMLDGQVEGYVILPGETAKYYIQPLKCLSSLTSDTHVHDQTQAAETDGGNSQENPECSAEHCFKLQNVVDLSSCDASSSVCRSCSVIRRMSSFHENWIPCVETRGKIRFTWLRENVCDLHLIADPTLWRYFKYERFETTLTNKKTSEEIKKFFAGRVSTLKRIFGDTEFRTYDGREMFRGIDFAVDRLTIMTDTTEKCNTSRPNVLCSPHLSLNEFLTIIASVNHDEYCLAVIFTYRDFDEAVSGTPIASPYEPWGGICDRYMGHLSDENTLHYGSGNVVWMTLGTKSTAYNDKESHLLLARTVGNAFGSPDDDVPDCVPGANSPGGNYLMYKEISLKNERFSICSKDNITRFLSSVIYSRHGRYNCLKPSASGEGLLHRIFSPKISSFKGYSKLPKYGYKQNDEL